MGEYAYDFNRREPARRTIAHNPHDHVADDRRVVRRIGQRRGAAGWCRWRWGSDTKRFDPRCRLRFCGVFWTESRPMAG